MKIDKTFLGIFFALLVLAIGCAVLINGVQQKVDQDNMDYEDKMIQNCRNLGLELFDYSKGNIFKHKKIDCFNETTGEILSIG